MLVCSVDDSSWEANNVILCLYMPFFFWQIRDFHIAKREEDIGFYAGFVGNISNA